MLIRLGKRHHALGVRPQQYGSMQRSILVSLEELLGNEWNSEYSDAWACVFSFISHVMIKAAHEEGVRMARGGKEEEMGKGSVPQPPAVVKGGRGGEGGSGCPFTAPTAMPVNKLLSGLQHDAASAKNVHADGHFLHRAGSPNGGNSSSSSSHKLIYN